MTNTPILFPTPLGVSAQARSAQWPVQALAALRQQTANDPLRNPLLFWGHTEKVGTTPSQACLSQWYPAAFEVDGVHYPTAEHFMMAEKARLFGDVAVAQAMLAASTPKEVKALGRKVKGFDEARWVQARFDIVVRGNWAKFSQHAALGNFLRHTDNRVLVEASPVDAIWGIGLAADHPHAVWPEHWQGLNLLGFALMAVRDALPMQAT